MSLRSCRKLGFLTLVLLLAGLVSPMASAAGGGGDPLQVVDYRSMGSTVAVTVANNDSVAHNALVTVTVTVAGDTLQAAGTVKVFGNDSAVVVVNFSGAVDEIIIVGINQGSDPM